MNLGDICSNEREAKRSAETKFPSPMIKDF
jgi:hypothetical protein